MPVAGFESARAVADAVLYEGYLLYPHRRSSGKNRVRWQFGVLAPRKWVEATGVVGTSVAGSADAWHQQTECLLQAPDPAAIHVRLRFLQLQHRSVEARDSDDPDGDFHERDMLDVDGQRHLTFDEAVPREFDIVVQPGELSGDGHTATIAVPGGEDVEALGEAARVVRRCWPISATVRLSVAPVDASPDVLKLRLVTENTGDSVAAGASRAEALRTSLVATHSLIGVRGGAFLSLLDPPAWAAAAAKQCRNVHTYPVLAGDPESRNVMLSSPILMDYDYPQVSPESPGDLFDATEIDEILSLRTLTLTDDEKREARATDPRAAAIIDRVEEFPHEVLERLHGAIRSLRPVTRPVTTDGAGEGRPFGEFAVVDLPEWTTSEGRDRMDAIELLCHDHRMVEQLFRDYKAVGSDNQRRGVVEIIVRELSKHAALEELMFYPLAKKVLLDGEKEIDEHLAEHLSVKKTLAALDELSAGDERTDDLMAELQGEIEHHVADEEDGLMPKVREAVDQEALDELGQAIDKAKQAAPTRPHPQAPDQLPGLVLAGPVAAIYDRLRDRLQGRPLT